MVFSSVTFLFYFLPVLLFAYFALPFKNTVLLLASLFFYAWGEAGYILVLIFSIFLNYVFGLIVNREYRKLKIKKFVLGVAVFLNLALLSYYKYFNFLVESVFNFELESQVHLPLGISFFSFQAISYLIDVYRKEAKVEKNPFNLALYISMFPQLIAGPIVRFKTVAQQIQHRKSKLLDINKGIHIFVIGLAQKVLLANTFAIPTDEIFLMNEVTLTTALAWLGTVTYSLQIYFDFAGYSNMAIGLGLVLGFTFSKNFNYPYISQSITEFWRRWHMSLSSWFRDYLYIPLGGNRLSPVRTYANLLVVFLLCGLWHGAAWTFIIWGAYHGFFLILERFKLNQLLSKTWVGVRHAYTILVIMVGWIIFRADDLQHLQYFLSAFFGFTNVSLHHSVIGNMFNNLNIVSMIIGMILSVPIFKVLKFNVSDDIRMNKTSKYVSFSFYSEFIYFTVFILSVLKVSSGSYNPFIYFRF